MSADEDVDLDLGHEPTAAGRRLTVRSLGAVARYFQEAGGPPPVPVPTVGLAEGGALPLFYPGLNGLAGEAGIGKSMLTKWVALQVLRSDGHVLVFDCESTLGEYTATMMADFGANPMELERLHYVVDRDARDWLAAKWGGHMSDDLLDDLAEQVGADPPLVLMDSMSKSMAVAGLDERQPIPVATWFEQVSGPVVDRWPGAAVVFLQARPKGWFKGMDVRQGRGSSSLLHEVKAQYMLWQRKPGSRRQDGLANLVSTKDRYGHRVDGSVAGIWHYGPSGIWLQESVQVVAATPEEVREALFDWLGQEPKDPNPDPKWAYLPPTFGYAVAQVVGGLAGRTTDEEVGVVLRELVNTGLVQCQKVQPEGVRGVKPERVWLG